jgi:hypothetical protein
METMTPEDAVRNAHVWFENNSGWAPPDVDELAEWVADGVCRCPDRCLVAPDAWCEHGLASWWLILEALDEEARNHRERQFNRRSSAGLSPIAGGAESDDGGRQRFV